MRRLRGKLLATALITLFMLNLGVVFNVYGGAPLQMGVWIEPQSHAFTAVGEKLDVVVWANVTDPPALYTWQVHINFPSWLKCNWAGYSCPTCNATYPHDAAKSEMFHGMPTVPVVPIITATYVEHGESLMGDFKASGVKRLMWAQFEVITAPNKYETLTGNLDTNNAATFLLDPTLASISPIYKGKCAVSFAWTPPPPAALGVVPQSVVFNKYTNVTKLTYPQNPFDIEVKLKHLNALWKVTRVYFCLCFNSTMLRVEPGTGPGGFNITAKPGWTITLVSYVPGVPDKLYINATWVGPPTEPSGDNVPIVDILFKVIIMQGTSPPLPMDYYEESTIVFCEYEVWDTVAQITLDPPQNGKVRVYSLEILKPGILRVDPKLTTLGPEPSICKNFTVNIVVGNSTQPLDAAWKCVGVQWYLLYDKTKIEFVGAEEGPFLKKYGTYGTFWLDPIEEPASALNPPTAPGCTHHILFANMLLTNPVTGQWPGEETGVWPNGTGVVAILTFHLLYQSYGEPDYKTPLNLDAVTMPIAGISCIFMDKDLGPIPYEMQHGEVLVKTDLPGRMIDLTAGDGCVDPPGPWPAPFGGQGFHKPSDMFWNQKIVYLYAYVKYNYWPTQDKDVGFQIEGPFNQTTMARLNNTKVWVETSARTDKDGMAWIKFQLPWTGCSNPEQWFGKWKVTATVDICCTVVNDTLTFDYRYVVEWVKITTDKYEYKHCEYVKVTVEWRSKAQQERPIYIAVNIFDELETPFGIAWIKTTVKGAKPCTYVYYKGTVSIHIPKWAFAGIAELYVSAFNKSPTEGGFAWCPTHVNLNPLCIQPY